MKLYDLSYSYFLILLEFQGVFFEVKIMKLLVAVRFKQDLTCSDPEFIYIHLTFLYFSLVCRLIHRAAVK